MSAGDNGLNGDRATPLVAVASAAVASTAPLPAAPVDDDAPVIESREVELPKNPRKKVQFNMTFLDGTTIKMPSGTGRKKKGEIEPARNASGELEVTAAELLAALRAAAHGADAADVLGSDIRWEKMMAAVLSLLLKKHLILDRELMEELRKI